MTCLNLVPESMLQEPKVIKNACMALASIVEARGKRTTVSFFQFLSTTLELFTEYEVIVKKSSPKNLSADCRSTVGRQLTNRLPTVYRQVKKKEKLC